MSISLLYSSTTFLNTKTFNPNQPHYSFASKISCKVPNKNEHQTTNKNDTNILKLDRRNVLIGLGSLCGAKIMQVPSLETAHAVEKPAQTSANDVLPRKLDTTIRTQVPRAQKSRTKKQKEELEEVLNVNMELLQTDKYIKFDVFINEEDDNPSKIKLMNTEYAGSFVNVPHRNRAGKGYQKTKLSLGLTDLIQDLGVDGDDSVEVVLVPRAGSGDVVITDMKIDYMS